MNALHPERCEEKDRVISDQDSFQTNEEQSEWDSAVLQVFLFTSSPVLPHVRLFRCWKSRLSFKYVFGAVANIKHLKTDPKCLHLWKTLKLILI